jgi:hypothetical protein
LATELPYWQASRTNVGKRLSEQVGCEIGQHASQFLMRIIRHAVPPA